MKERMGMQLGIRAARTLPQAVSRWSAGHLSGIRTVPTALALPAAAQCLLGMGSPRAQWMRWVPWVALTSLMGV